MNDNKPQEFQLCKLFDGSGEVLYWFVEKSAYDALLKENERLRTKLANFQVGAELLVDQFFVHDSYGMSDDEIMKEALTSAKRRSEFEGYDVHNVKIAGKVDRHDKIIGSTLSTYTIHVYGVKND